MAGTALRMQGPGARAARRRRGGLWEPSHARGACSRAPGGGLRSMPSTLRRPVDGGTHGRCTHAIPAHAQSLHTHGLCVGGLLVACGVGSAPAPPSAVWRPLATACCAGPWTGSRILADVLELGGRARNRCRRRAPFDSSFDFRGKFTGRRCCAGRCPYESVAPMCPMPLSCCYVAAMLDAWVCKAFHRAAPCTSPSWTLIPNKSLSLSLSLSLSRVARYGVSCRLGGTVRWASLESVSVASMSQTSLCIRCLLCVRCPFVSDAPLCETHAHTLPIDVIVVLVCFVFPGVFNM